MLIKLDDAIAAYMQRRFGGSEEVVAALRALPVSDGWEDIATAPLMENVS